MGRPRRRGPLALLLAVGLVGPCSSIVEAAPPEAAPPEAAPPEADPSDAELAERKTRAKAEVKAASAAFQAGDYATAIVHYEAAIAILPSPKLHYNIGVCHQRLSLQTEDPTERTLQRDLAIESYNRYLEENPQADDRLEVAELVRDLGGTPVVNAPLKSDPFEGRGLSSTDTNDIVEADTVEADTGEVIADPPVEPLPEAEPRKPYYPHHGRFGIMLAPGFGSGLPNNQDIAARALLAADLHGGGYVGMRRRFFLGIHTSLYSGIGGRADRLRFSGGHFGLLFSQQWVVARERLAIGLGGTIELAAQSISQRQDAAPSICSLSGTTSASRFGGAFGARIDLSLLVGAKRRGMLMLMVAPGVDVFAPSRVGEGCLPGQTPWNVLGLTDRWQFMLFTGLGFALRF